MLEVWITTGTGDTYEILPYEEFIDVAEDGQDDVRGISIGNGNDILIQYCKVINSGYGGITTGYARCISTHKYSENIIIDHCISSDHPAAGISIGNNVGPFTVTNNICCNNGSPHPTDPSRQYRGYGIQVSGTKNYGRASGLIANNVCTDNKFEGIIVARYTDGVTVDDNEVTGSNLDEDGAGIFVYGGWGTTEQCQNHTIKNNTVTGNIKRHYCIQRSVLHCRWGQPR